MLVAGLTLYGCKTQKTAATTSAADSSTKQKSKFKPYNKVITAEAKSDTGLFTTHRVDDKLYFTIPDSLMGKDMLLVSRIAKVPSGYGGGYVNAGSKVNEQVIRWSKRGNYVDARVISFENQSDEDSPISKSVEANNFCPILFSAEVETKTPDSTGVVIDVTKLFTQDIAAINAVSPRSRKQYKIRRLDMSFWLENNILTVYAVLFEGIRL